MEYKIKSAICVFILSVIFMYFQKEIFFWSKYDCKNHFDLVIGVLSTRNNIAYRAAVRNLVRPQITRLDENLNVKLLFILGKDDCPYHQDDRIDPHSCISWNFKSNYDFQNTDWTTSNIFKGTQQSCISKLLTTFTFEVGKLAIRIPKIGILSSALIPNEPVFVIITDITKKVYAKAKFINGGGFQNTTYLYSNIDEYIYPANFKGTVLIKGIISSNLSVCADNFEWNTGGNLIAFENERDLKTRVAIPAFTYKIHNETELREYLKSAPGRLKQRQDEIAQFSSYLEKEQIEHKDLVFVDVVDVYRNLPTKLLKFLIWLVNTFNFNYFLKTDDDCSLNIDLILQNLKVLNESASKKLWWGNFRKDWLVNRIGKWADVEYLPNTYPLFACGSGNVLTYHLVNWLAKNHDFLYPFQGEDVSLGIWLSGLLPYYFHDEKWSCDENCEVDSYVRAQLNLQEITKSQQFLEKCGSICSC